MLDFNIFPYFDDFKKSKHFYKVLFKPETDVQARELNTLQSIFYNQLKSFSNHVFKNGSRVSGGRISIVNYKTLTLNTSKKINAKEGDFIIGRESKQTARFIMQIDNTIYIDLQGSNLSGEKQTFKQGEIIDVVVNNGNIIDTTQIINHPYFEGIGYVFVIEEGIFYYQGYFIHTPKKTIKINKFIDSQIGFEVNEKIITTKEDARIVDNNNFSYSYLNPGADRYQIDLKLVQKPLEKGKINDTESTSLETIPGFIILAQIKNGKIQLIKADSEYNELGDMIAQRTYEESGNYTVKPFKLTVKNHKAKSENDELGIDINGSEDHYVAIVGPGIGYVKGYRSETLSDTYLISEKARNTEKVSGYINYFSERSYFRAIPLQNSSAYPGFALSANVYDNNMKVSLYDGEFGNGNIPTGDLVAEIEIYDVVFDGMTNEQTPRKIFKYYIKSIRLEPNKKIESAKSIFNSTATFSAIPFIDPILGKFTIQNPGKSELLWELDKKFVKSLKDIDNPFKNSINLTLRKKLVGTLDSAGKITFTAKTNEYFKPFSKNTICTLYQQGVSSFIELTQNNSSCTPLQIVIDLGTDNAGKNISIITDVVLVNANEKIKTVDTNDELFNDPELDSYQLQKADIISVKVFLVNKLAYSDETQWIDVTNSFDVDNGQKDTFYTNGSIKRNSTPFPPSFDPSIHWLKVSYLYFKHSGDGAFFTVDSYKSISYEEIPIYKSQSKRDYFLSNCFDFRPLILNDSPQENVELPSFNQSAIFDIEYYIGRVDSIVLTKDRELKIVKGIPSETPAPPSLDDDCMVLYNLWLSPYTFSLNDIQTEFIENKRYTMRDIGLIDEKLRTIEYYTGLSMLEKTVADMKVKDVNGFDRFKNGFVVDDFSNFIAGDTTSNEFKASIDPEYKELRPKFTARSKKLKIDKNKSGNVKIIDNMAYLPFDEELIDQQQSASKHISINPYLIVSKRGTITLSPNNDVWANTNTTNKQITIDTGSTREALQNMLRYTNFDTVFGSWSEVNRTISSQTVTSGNAVIRRDTAFITETRTNTINEIGSRTTTYEAGTRVTNVEIIPFMRSIDIEFLAENMLENTPVYAFFDGKPVSQFCRPIDGSFGSQLITDSTGKLRGVFRVPDNTFFTGERVFELSGDPKNERNIDTELTYAKTVFFAGGINVNKEQLGFNVVTPVFSSRTISERRNRTETQETVLSVVNPEPANPVNPEPVDPVAQSFNFSTDRFVTGIGLYFKSVDERSKRIFVQIRTMKNGYPTSEVLAERIYKPEELKQFVSADASIEFKVKFTYPIFVKANTEYCFVVGGDSPGTRIWVARLGENDVTTSNLIETQPSLGSSFRSQNGVTWTAEQFEDIKYKIYGAKFTSSEMTLVFEADKNEYEKLEQDPFECEKGVKLIRIYAKDHGLKAGDTVSISMFSNHDFIIASTTEPIVGQRIKTSSGTAIINNVEKNGNNHGQYKIKVKELKGLIKNHDSFECNSEIIRGITAPYIYGTVISAPITEINGIDLKELNGDLIVKSIDSKDSFVVEINSLPNASGRFGGTGVEILMNYRYEAFNCSGHYEKYSCSEEWDIATIDYDNRLNRRKISLGADYHLDKSQRLLSDKNSIDPSIVVSSKFTTNSNNISPVINLDTFSIVLITNSIDEANQDIIEQKPNSVGRYKPETDPNQGSHSFKYVTRKITLAKPANDLRIAFDVFKDKEADFDVYIKTQKQYSTDNIDDYPWILVPIDKKKNSSNLDDRIEYEFDCSNFLGQIEEFISFKVKIVGRTTNPAKPPLFRNLRIIAHS